MKYDPVKRILGTVVQRRPLLRVLFYKILGVMFLREWHVKRALRRLLKGRTAPMLVYDAGSGFGQYSYFIARQFPNVSVYGVDVKEEQIADCNFFFQRVGLTRCTFTVEDLNVMQHDHKFDLALSVDVMEHLPDDVGVLRNLFRALKKGGFLVINTPSELGGSDAGSANDPGFIEEHARNGYGVDEIRTKLTSVGFVVESIAFTYGTWGSLAWRFGIKVPMLMVNVSKVSLILLPFYYMMVLPFILPLMAADYCGTNARGTGLLVLARKP